MNSSLNDDYAGREVRGVGRLSVSVWGCVLRVGEVEGVVSIMSHL